MKLIVAATLVAYASAFTAPTMATRAVKKVVPKKVVAKPVAKKVVAKAKPVATKAVAKAKPVATKAVAKAKPVVKKVVAKAKPVAKKVVAKAKPVVKKVAPKPVVRKVVRSGVAGPSIALPFEKAPSTLDGSMLGDFGFDPLGFSTVGLGTYFEDFAMVPQGTLSDIAWYREAELMHGRIAQLAVVGFIWPALFGTIPGNDWTGADAFSYTNPLEEYSNVPFLTVMQIVLFMAYLENRRVGIIKEDGASHMPGDSRWGQGPGRYNPFNLDYTPEEYAEKQLQELKHCRLAMVGVFGLWAQASNSGISVVDQLSAAFTAPDYYAKAGYFLPEGI